MYIRIIYNKKAGHAFYIYANACILNRTESDLEYYYSNFIGKDIIAGQNPKERLPLPISKREKLKIKFPNYPSISKKVSISKDNFLTLFRGNRS